MICAGIRLSLDRVVIEIKQVGGACRLEGSLPDRRSVMRLSSGSAGEVLAEEFVPECEEKLAILCIRMLTDDGVPRVKISHALLM
jgi:hypothetical protein